MKKTMFFITILLLLGGCATVDENDAVEHAQRTIKEFTLIAENWNFTPSTIRVNEGDLVIIHAQTVEGIHGLLFPDFDINTRLDPGEEVTIEFVADKKGTFPFMCSVYCGKGHTEMRGTLVVE